MKRPYLFLGCLYLNAQALALQMSGAGPLLDRRHVLGGLGALAGVGALSPAAVLAEKGDDVLSNERIFDTRVHSYLPPVPQRLIRQGWAHEVVCVGEQHSHGLHHRMQYNIAKALNDLTRTDDADGRVRPLAIGLEMFYRSHQGALDRYVFGHGNLALLKAETNWDDTWGYDFASYSKIFRYSRLYGIRMIGLNAPAPLLSLVGKVGLSNLPPELKRLIPEVDTTQEAHRARFTGIMEAMAASHGKGGTISEERMQRMYECQCLWDDFMSDSAAKYLSKLRSPGRLLVLAGINHVEGRDGIPDRLEKRTGMCIKPFTVVPQSVDWTPEGLPDIVEPPSQDFADWVYYTTPEMQRVGTA
ncbi:unnamed protein product [Chrysoparadoxa australica]